MTIDTTPDPLAASAVRTWIEPPTSADTIMRAMTSPHLVRVPIGLRTYTGTAIVTGNNVLVIACHLGPVTGNRRGRRVVAMQLVRDEAAELREKLAAQGSGPAIDLPPANTGPLPVMVHEVREEFQAEPGSVLAEVAGAPQEPGQISDQDAYARAVERGSIVPLGADGQPVPYLLTVFNSDHGLTVTPAPSIERGTMKFGSLPGDIDRGGFVMQLQGPRVSRFHAVISIAGPERWTVTDCGSEHGTAVNGTRIGGPVEFGLGDAVLIGENTIKIGKRRPDADAVSSAGFNVNMIEVGGAADVYETGDPVIDALVAEGLAGLPSDWIGKAQAHGPMLAAVARMMRYGAGAIGPGFIPGRSKPEFTPGDPRLDGAAHNTRWIELFHLPGGRVGLRFEGMLCPLALSPANARRLALAIDTDAERPNPASLVGPEPVDNIRIGVRVDFSQDIVGAFTLLFRIAQGATIYSRPGTSLQPHERAVVLVLPPEVYDLAAETKADLDGSSLLEFLQNENPRVVVEREPVLPTITLEGKRLADLIARIVQRVRQARGLGEGEVARQMVQLVADVERLAGGGAVDPDGDLRDVLRGVVRAVQRIRGHEAEREYVLQRVLEVEARALSLIPADDVAHDASGVLPSTTRAFELARMLRQSGVAVGRKMLAEAADLLEGLSGIDIGVGDTARFASESPPVNIGGDLLIEALRDVEAAGFKPTQNTLSSDAFAAAALREAIRRGAYRRRPLSDDARLGDRKFVVHGDFSIDKVAATVLNIGDPATGRRDPSALERGEPTYDALMHTLQLALEVNQAEQGRIAELEAAIDRAQDFLSYQAEEDSIDRREQYGRKAEEILRRVR